MAEAATNQFEEIFALYARRMHDAPGAARLARLSQTAARVPAALLNTVAELLLRLDDPELAGNDIATHLVEIGYCDQRCAGATEFLTALAKRLRSYIDNPAAADAARNDYRKFVAWWRTGLNRTADLRRQLAVVLTQVMEDGA